MKVKRKWISRVATKKSDTYKTMRDRIATRTGAPITEADIREAFESGEEVRVFPLCLGEGDLNLSYSQGITILRMQCTGYDRAFIDAVESAHRQTPVEQVHGNAPVKAEEITEQATGVARSTRSRGRAASPSQSATASSTKTQELDKPNGYDSDGGLSYMSEANEETTVEVGIDHQTPTLTCVPSTAQLAQPFRQRSPPMK